MNYLKNIIYCAILLFVVMACDKEEFELGEAPNESQAVFTTSENSQGPNYINFQSNSGSFMKKWDFGNGTSAEGDNVTGYFAFAGEYTVTLTAYNSGGSVSTSQQITIDETDPTICNVEVLELLTGGCDQPDGKTWVVDADRAGHFGLGPVTSYGPDWYTAGANEKIGGGLYDDQYTFILNQFVYIQETNGDIYLNGGVASNFPGATESPVGDFTAPYTAPEDINYAVIEDNGNQYISFTNGGFLGYATGVNQYQVLSLSENEMFLRFLDAADATFAWYIRLIPEGYAPVAASFTPITDGLTVTFNNTSLNADNYNWDFGDGNTSIEENPVHTYAADGSYDVTLTATGPGQSASVTQAINVAAALTLFPITFEGTNTNFNGFGGSTFQVIDNPDPSGANISSRVGEYVKGFEGSWAGIETNLDEYIDFSENETLSFKVWSSVTGTALFKIEDQNDPNTYVEVFADITTANQWETLTFDFTGTASGTYNKVALFLDFDNNNGGTFYVDDIGFATEETNELTMELLTGGNSKSWVLKPEAGSFGVGPAKGSTEWFGSEDITGDRPCLFNDEYIFKTGGQYEYNTNGDFYGEAYMGVADQCHDESVLEGTDAEDWGSGIHSFSFIPATGSEPAYITVRGDGAFIALPKAFNGGEYSSAPPNMDASVTYEVLDYVKNAAGETLTLTIDVSEDGTGFWTFVLIPN